METILPIAAFAERAQLSRRTIERKIAIGEIAADYVQRRGRRVFIDAAALVTLAPHLSRHDATQQRQAAKPPDSPPELISAKACAANASGSPGGDGGAGAARGAAPPQRSHQGYNAAATPADPTD